MKTAVEWLVTKLPLGVKGAILDKIEQAKKMEKQRMIDFGDFIIDELAPMAQNRNWVEERYNYFKSEEDETRNT
jgi:hypothetical protein